MTKFDQSPSMLDSLHRLRVEQLRCFRIDAQRRRVFAVPNDQIADHWAGTSDEIWIDIQAPHPDEFRAFLESLSLHPLILEDCLDPNRSSRFSSYDRSMHFETPVYDGDSVDQYLSVLCLPRLLITLRTSPIPEFDRVLRELDQQVPLNEGTRSALLYAILDALTGRLVEAASNLRDKIRQMSHLMDTKPTEVKAGQIVSVKRRVQDIVMVVEDQLHCAHSLIAVNTEAFPMSQQRDYFRDAARNYESAMRILHRYEARASELQQQHVASLQARTESRLRILTILSAICMPLTLIAGIYGMNFSQMPELKITWGYPATLTMMLLIAVGQLWYFYRRGWFG